MNNGEQVANEQRGICKSVRNGKWWSVQTNFGGGLKIIKQLLTEVEQDMRNY